MSTNLLRARVLNLCIIIWGYINWGNSLSFCKRRIGTLDNLQAQARRNSSDTWLRISCHSGLKCLKWEIHQQIDLLCVGGSEVHDDRLQPGKKGFEFNVLLWNLSRLVRTSPTWNPLCISGPLSLIRNFWQETKDNPNRRFVVVKRDTLENEL